MKRVEDMASTLSFSLCDKLREKDQRTVLQQDTPGGVDSELAPSRTRNVMSKKAMEWPTGARENARFTAWHRL